VFSSDRQFILVRLACTTFKVSHIFACMHCGPRGYFRSECWTGGESMAGPPVNCLLVLSEQHRARGWTGRTNVLLKLLVWPDPESNTA